VIWDLAEPAPEDHPYLRNKSVKAHGLRLRAYDRSLVIPMRDGDELHSLQFIKSDGHKLFLTGGRVNGCHHLIGMPDNILCIGEGYATCASIHESTGHATAVAFNAGNLLPVARTLRSKVPSLRLIVCADDDVGTPGNPGLSKAREAAQAVGASLAAPDFGADRPDGATDFNDLHRHAGVEAVRGCIARASAENTDKTSPGDDGPLPLFPKPEAALPYPVEALGPVLARAVKAIAECIRVDIVMAAQSILSAASLAACSHADVRLPIGERQVRPLALYMATVSASGGRKSSSDDEALWPIERHERNLKVVYEIELEEWKRKHSAWSAQKRSVESDRKIASLKDREEAINLLGPEPLKPLAPVLRTGDITVEGMTNNWKEMLPALAVFTAEGATFTAGHAMNSDNRVKTAAMLSLLWDGKTSVRIRSTDSEISILAGRRLVFHLMIQPDVAAEFLGNPVLRDQGLLSRYLAAEPEKMDGGIGQRERSPQAEAAIMAYGARILSILERTPVMREGKRNELDPRILSLDKDATDLWWKFYEHVEPQRSPGGELECISDFAAKASEHAARIAGVLTIIEDIDAAEIKFPAMESGAKLIDWYLHEAARLRAAGRTDQKLLHAEKLLKWLQGRPGLKATFSEILQQGPRESRLKAAAEEFLGILTSHGWVQLLSPRPRIYAAVECPESSGVS
jgi:Protein of unknown function (DUF3987)/Toprim domain